MFSKNTDNNLLRVPSVLYDLQRSKTTEEEISVLTVLNEVISSNRKEMDLLYKLNGLRIIMKKMRDDERIINLCLKILVTGCKKDNKIRKNLLENDIFGILAIQLQSEYNFSKNNLILYTALIVIVVQGNEEAQCLIRKSGCLSSLVFILNYILDHSHTDGIPEKNTEMIIYAITSAIKNPRNAENQVEMRWIVGKIVSYLGSFSQLDNDIITCFWSFLRNVLDKNEINQETFLNCSGLIVLFRSLQEIIDDGKCQEFEEKLSKITGVLVKLKSHKEFLCQSSNYCSIMILCLLMNSNNSLVMQHVITFFSSLIKEIPRTLKILKDSQIQIVMRKALTTYSENTKHPVQDLWEALEISLSLQGFTTFNGSLKQILNYNQTFECQSLGLGSLHYPQSAQTDFCILHSSHPSKELQIFSSSLLDCSQPSWLSKDEMGRKSESWKPLDHWHFQRMQLAVAHLNLHRRELNRKEQKLREKIRQMRHGLPPVQTFRNDKSSSSVIKMASRRICQVLQKFWCYFWKTRSSDVVEWKRPVKSCQFINNQLLTRRLVYQMKCQFGKNWEKSVSTNYSPKLLISKDINLKLLSMEQNLQQELKESLSHFQSDI